MANHMLTILSKPESWKKKHDESRTPYQGVVKHDWVPTGRIDFATRLNGNASDESEQPNDFKLLVEERRIVESIAGNENLEIQWRLATLREAKVVIAHYHKHLADHGLIKSVNEEAAAAAAVAAAPAAAEAASSVPAEPVERIGTSS